MLKNVRRKAMRRFVFLVMTLAATSTVALAQGRPPRFWNLTGETISEFYLAPAGTTKWGPNQCKNDKDGTVDPDERLNITGVQPGNYDVKLADKTGRVCVVHDVKVEAAQIFSLEQKDLTSCNR
jgi:hypothetical protein